MTTTRQRLTWDDEARNASAHPATPDEGPASPAFGGPDPEANRYENGDTESWAEGVRPGPYPNSAHPATPDEGPASPAYKAATLNKKADRCIIIATAMLGESAPYNVIEDQALILMDMPDTAILASLKRLGEDVDEDEDEDEEGSKKASAKFASLESRIARVERILIRLADDDEDEDDDEDKKDDEEGSKKGSSRALKLRAQAAALLKMADDDEDSDDEEAKKDDKKANMYQSEEQQLEELLKEEGMWGMDESPEETQTPEELQLEELLKEEGMGEPEDMEPEYAEIDVELQGGMDDPMGVMDAEMDEGEMAILAQLYGPEGAAKRATDDGDADDEEEEEEEEEEGAKKASGRTAAKPRPQPKKASSGARRLGGPVTKEASDEISNLSSLWETAPDVSDHF